MSKKILFLDVDGVLNSRDTTNFKTLWPVDPYMVFMVGKIQLDTGCDIVLSSSWRHHPDGVKVVEDQLKIKLLGKTPTLGTKRGADGKDITRGEEIRKWLKDNGHEDATYAILDDDSDFNWDLPLFKTTFQSGLTPEIAKQVTDHLNGVEE